MKQNSSKLRVCSLVTLLAFSFATGCSTTQNFPSVPAPGDSQKQESENASTIPSDIIGPGFQFQLRNLEDKSLNGSFRVAFDGKILLPYNVAIHAAGMSLSQFEAAVEEAYKPFFKHSSNLHVELVDRAYWVDIRGLATKPGRYLIKQDTSIDEVISKAGGFPKDTPAKYMKITTSSASRSIDLDRYYRTGEPTHLSAWEGGEKIFFQSEDSSPEAASATEKSTLRILGEVRRPGEVSFRSGADFLYYLSEAGGPTHDMNPSKIQIFRGDNSGRTVQEFSIDKQTSFPALQKGDTVMVYADRPTPFERFLQSGVGIASIISAIALVIIAGQHR